MLIIAVFRIFRIYFVLKENALRATSYILAVKGRIFLLVFAFSAKKNE